MGSILARFGTRCQEHPHRGYHERCDRCGLPFCDECLDPSARRGDGTREWYCRGCIALMDERTRRRLAESALAHRAARAAMRARAFGVALVAVGVLIGSTGAGYFALARSYGAATEQALPERAAACGDLTRIRSIGAIGTQAGQDAVNVLAYPHRAAVRMVGSSGGSGRASAAADAGAHGPAALVDECDAGWRHEGSALPASLVLDTGRQGSYVQRIALWQDPHAPREAWVRDFELLASPSETGDDFVRLTLDRPTALRETTEPQWFEIVRPMGGGAPPFPDAVEMRRLQLRVLTTLGAARDGARDGSRLDTTAEGGAVRVALGEVAAFGPDVEIVVAHPIIPGQVDKVDRSAFELRPGVVRALAGRPTFVLFVNRGTTAETHHIVSVGQEQNLDLRVGPGEARSGMFIAGLPGTYELFCRTAGHALVGFSGTISVR